MSRPPSLALPRKGGGDQPSPLPSLSVRAWPVERPTATICISHGMGDHSGRYAHFAQRLNGEGWSVFAPDHRGHGRSQGRRGHVDAWADYIEDFHRAIEAAADPSLPRALIGQSMGGLVATGYALAHGETLAALVLLSPMFGLFVSPRQARLARILSRALPWFSVPNNIDGNALSRDPAVAVAYRADPLTHEKVSARWLTEAMGAMADAHRRAAEVQVPTLLFFGDSDRIVQSPASRALFEQMTAPDRKLVEWPGCYHELLNETVANEVMERIVQWLKVRLRPTLAD